MTEWCNMNLRESSAEEPESLGISFYREFVANLMSTQTQQNKYHQVYQFLSYQLM